MAPKKSKPSGHQGGSSNPPVPPARKEPLAIITINVQAEDTEFVNQINEFRNRMAALGGNRRFNNTPSLPAAPQDPRDSDIVHVRLTGNDGIVNSTLQLRVHDLYMGGFANKVKKWFQFHGHQPAIRDSTVLSVGDNYTSLKSKAGCRHLSDILCMGEKKVTLHKAMMVLANTTEQNKNSQLEGIALSLLTIILHCCEATRFSSILSHPIVPRVTKDSWEVEYDEVTIATPGWVDRLVLNWGNMSRLVRERYNRGQDQARLNIQMFAYNLVVPRLENGRAVERHLATTDDAENELGIIN